MAKIRVKNFGPIKEGLSDNGWIDIKNVTVFVGDQGSGRSTLAKLIATFIWMEKVLVRGDYDIDWFQQKDRFRTYQLKYYRLESYWRNNSEIEYNGDTYHFLLTGSQNRISIEAIKLAAQPVKLPKLMYVPSERNVLSSVSDIIKVPDLLAGSLKDYSIEFRNAQLYQKGRPIDLPINDAKIVYDVMTDENYLIFDGKRLRLTDASSGFHSMVPLHWVSNYLMEFLGQGDKKILETLSTDQTIRRNNELRALNRVQIDESLLREKERQINDKYISRYFISIVEEPEQNLSPAAQRDILHSLVTYNQLNSENKLIMTTHSPYLLTTLDNLIQAGNAVRERPYLRDRVTSLIDESIWVDFDMVSCYYFSNGTIYSTLNPELKSINPSKIDEVSEDLSATFEDLLELRYAEH